MAFPTVEAVAETLVLSNETLHNVSLPAPTGGILANDILLIVGVQDAASTATWPSGWTELKALDVQGATAKLFAGWKRAAGGETGTVTVTLSIAERAVWRCYCIRGAHTTSAPEVSTGAAGDSTNADPDALTPTWGAEDTLWLAVAGWDLQPVVSAGPTNYTNFETSTGFSAGTVSVARRALNATSENPGAFTSDKEQWAAVTVGIRPTAAATTVYGAAVLTGVGAMAAVAKLVSKVASLLSGSGTLSATSKSTSRGQTVQAGSGTLSASAKMTNRGAGVLSGAGSLAGAPKATNRSGGSLSGAGNLSGSPKTTSRGSSTVSGSGTLSGTPKTIIRASATLSGQGKLTGGDVGAIIVRPGELPLRGMGPS